MFKCVWCGHPKEIGTLHEVEPGKWHTIGYCPRCGEATHSEHKSTLELQEMGIELPGHSQSPRSN